MAKSKDIKLLMDMIFIKLIVKIVGANQTLSRNFMHYGNKYFFEDG